MKAECTDYTEIFITVIVCASLLVAYYIYIDRQVKMVTRKPEKKSKITVRVLAAGFVVAYGVMLFPTAKETLDFQVYSMKIEAYNIVRAAVFLGALTFGLITGGTYLSNIKGNAGN